MLRSMNNNDNLCLCAECGRMVRQTDNPVQCPIYDWDGNLDQILLAHRTCRPEWAKWDDLPYADL